jgi:hypothetical protein
MLKFEKTIPFFFSKKEFFCEGKWRIIWNIFIFNMESSNKSETRRILQILQFFQNFVFNKDFGHYYGCLIITERLWTT